MSIWYPVLLLILTALLLDYIVRQKMHGTNLNWYIVEQLPVIPLDHGMKPSTLRSENGRVRSYVKAVLELTYTAHDMAPFARDMGHVNEDGKVKPPFVWDEERRLHLRAKLNAVFFHLYGVTDRNDVRYVFSTFPIVKSQEINTYGIYKSCELCLAYINALGSGDPDAEISL